MTNTKNNSITIGLVDDQQLFLKSLCALLETFPSFDLVLDALNGQDLLKRMELRQEAPDILLVDVNMPLMDGAEVAMKVAEKYPLTRIVALSMKDDDISIIAMLKAGCCAYLVKDIHPDELEKALKEIHAKGFYNGDAANVNYRRLIIRAEQEADVKLSDRELTFLRLSGSDLTYKQIAARMCLAERTIDGYRDALFEKLNVQSRVGMVLEGLRKKLITL